jgi:hypothetical protein
MMAVRGSGCKPAWTREWKFANGVAASASKSRSRRRIEEGPLKEFVDDIKDRTEENSDFRRVLYTGTHMQLVLMARQRRLTREQHGTLLQA